MQKKEKNRFTKFPKQYHCPALRKGFVELVQIMQKVLVEPALLPVQEIVFQVQRQSLNAILVQTLILIAGLEAFRGEFAEAAVAVPYNKVDGSSFKGSVKGSDFLKETVCHKKNYFTIWFLRNEMKYSRRNGTIYKMPKVASL